ncbi:MAG: ribosome recycling factor [Candidatus Kuenenbacteria bacterium]
MNLEEYRENFDKLIGHVNHELNSIRTNRAAPAMLENIQVEAYGAKTPLIQMASIQVPEPKMLIVEPWDKNVLKNIEKAIQTASFGLSVVNEGNFLRITVPAMTEETRNELIKLLNSKLEDGRQAVRGVRDDIKEKIVKAEKEKEISEDEKFKLIEKLDEMAREYNGKIKGIGEKKESEIKL